MSAGTPTAAAGDDPRERLQLVPLHVRRPNPTSTAAAPSTMAELFPPVCTPPNAGRMRASASSEVGTNVRVLLDERLLAAELQAAGLSPGHLEGLVLHRADFAGEEAVRLRRERPLEAARGIGIDFGPPNVEAAREVLRGAAHVAVDRRIEQRLPQEILELHRRAETEAGAMRVGRDGIAAHRFRTDAERERCAPEHAAYPRPVR